MLPRRWSAFVVKKYFLQQTTFETCRRARSFGISSFLALWIPSKPRWHSSKLLLYRSDANKAIQSITPVTTTSKLSGCKTIEIHKSPNLGTKKRHKPKQEEIFLSRTSIPTEFLVCHDVCPRSGSLVALNTISVPNLLVIQNFESYGMEPSMVSKRSTTFEENLIETSPSIKDNQSTTNADASPS